MLHLRLVHDALPKHSAAHGIGPARLSIRDLMAVSDWLTESDKHGYRRILIEGGEANGSLDRSGYVLVYGGSGPWAEWGLERGAGGIGIWHCATGCDAGQFLSMRAALDSLPAPNDSHDWRRWKAVLTESGQRRQLA